MFKEVKMIRIKRSRFGAIRSLLFVGLFAIGLVATTVTPALASGTFQRTGSMNVARYAHTATLLANGEALVAGGDNSIAGGSSLASAEAYNPATGAGAAPGRMDGPGEGH